MLKAQCNIRQTISIGELLTILQCMVPSGYNGPVDVVTGAQHFICCGSDCHFKGDLIAAVLPTFLPSASEGSQSFVVPETGHNLNGHHRAREAYEHMFQFLNDNGLGVKGEETPEHVEF